MKGRSNCLAHFWNHYFTLDPYISSTNVYISVTSLSVYKYTCYIPVSVTIRVWVTGTRSWHIHYADVTRVFGLLNWDTNGCTDNLITLSYTRNKNSLVLLSVLGNLEKAILYYMAYFESLVCIIWHTIRSTEFNVTWVILFLYRSSLVLAFVLIFEDSSSQEHWEATD